MYSLLGLSSICDIFVLKIEKRASLIKKDKVFRDSKADAPCKNRCASFQQVTATLCLLHLLRALLIRAAALHMYLVHWVDILLDPTCVGFDPAILVHFMAKDFPKNSKLILGP